MSEQAVAESIDWNEWLRVENLQPTNRTVSVTVKQTKKGPTLVVFIPAAALDGWCKNWAHPVNIFRGRKRWQGWLLIKPDPTKGQFKPASMPHSSGIRITIRGDIEWLPDLPVPRQECRHEAQAGAIAIKMPDWYEAQ